MEWLPLKTKLLKTLEANPLDFEHPPTKPEKDQPDRMFWVPDQGTEENPTGRNSLFLLRQIMKVPPPLALRRAARAPIK